MSAMPLFLRLRRLVQRADREVLVHGLGLAPIAAVTESLAETLVLLACFGLVLGAGAGLLQWLQPFIAVRLRVVVLVTVTTLLVALVDLVLAAVAWELSRSLAFYLPLLAMNALLLARLEAVAVDADPRHDGPLSSRTRRRAQELLVTCGTVAALVLAVFAFRFLARHAGFIGATLLGFEGPSGLVFFATPGGALVALGIVLGIARFIGDLEDDHD